MQTAAETRAAPTLAQFSENWIWRALYCLVESPSFDPSPRWIAAKLDITIEKAVDALEGLQGLGLIERSGNTYKVISSRTYHQINTSHMPARELLLDHIKVAPQILSKIDIEDGFTTQFFLGNRDLIHKYGPKFIALYEEMEREARSLNITEVVASELSFVQVTKNIGGK